MAAFAIFWFACALPAETPAGDWSEDARNKEVLRASIKTSLDRIAQAGQRVNDALATVGDAEKWEEGKWAEVGSAMDEYAQACDTELSDIDFHVQQLLELDPTAYVPPIDVKPPDFVTYLGRLRGVNQDLRARYDKTNEIEASMREGKKRVVREMREKTEEEMSATTGVPIGEKRPADDQDKGSDEKLKDTLEKGATKLLDTLVGGAGLAIWGLKLNFGLYYYGQEMKAQVRSIKNYDEGIAWVQQYRTKTGEAIDKTDRGLEKLTKLDGQSGKVRDKAAEIQKKFSQYTETGKERQKRERDQEMQEFYDKERTPCSPCYYWPADPPKTIEVSEYMDEVKSILDELTSAVDAAMVGGDPLVVAEIVESRGWDLWNKYQKAREQYDKAVEAYNQAGARYGETTNQAGQEYSAATTAIYARRWEHTSDRDAALASVLAAYRSKTNAAVAAYKPIAAALQPPCREMVRLTLIGRTVWWGTRRLVEGLREYAYATTSNLNRVLEDLSGQHKANMGAVSRDAWEAWEYMSQYKYVSERFSDPYAYAASEFRWGRSIEEVQSSLRGAENSMRAGAEFVAKRLGDCQARATEAQTQAGQFEEEVREVLDKDAKVIATAWTGLYQGIGFPEVTAREFSVWQIGNEKPKDRIEWYYDLFEKRFAFTEPDSLAKIKEIDFTSMADKIREVADEMNAWYEILAFYRSRREVALNRMDAVCNKVAGYGLFERPAGGALDALRKELTGDPWKGWVTSLEAAAAAEAKVPRPEYAMMPWGNMLPRQRLIAAQAALYRQAQKVMKDYILSKSGRGLAFMAVNADEFTTLAAEWEKLKPLFARFDQLAGPERARVSQAPGDQQLYAMYEPPTKTYNGMPPVVRGVAADDQRSLAALFIWLREYVAAKSEALRPVTEPQFNNVFAALDAWITGYPDDLKAHQELQRRAQEESERRLREWQAAQQRAEEERRAKEQEATRTAEAELKSVKEMYAAFALAYRNRDERGLLQHVSTDWEAAGDMTYDDLEESLQNSFSVFDEVEFSIQDLQLRRIADTLYSASYKASLVGRIRSQGLVHEENSQVSDEVVITPSGPKIHRTSGGRIWLK